MAPEKLSTQKKVYAGKDMVGLDALCCYLLKVNPREVLHIRLAHESGWGDESCGSSHQTPSVMNYCFPVRN